MIVLVEVTRVEVGPSEVGSSWKVSLSEKVMLVLLAVEAAAVEEGSGFLPSRRVLSRAIKAGSRSCHQGGFSVVPSKRVRDLAIKVAAGS